MERKNNLEEALKNRETWLIVLEVTSIIVIMIAALVGNIILCLTIYKVHALRKFQNYYIVTLSTSDFLLTLLCVSLSLVAASYGRWPFGDTVCQIQGSLTFFFATFSLLLIAINRYFKMVRSANIYQKMYTKNNVLLSIVATGIFSAMFTILFASQKYCFHPGIIACFTCKSQDTKEQAYFLGSCAVLFVLCYPVIMLCYYKVFRKVRAHSAQIVDSTLNQDALKLFTEEIKITKTLFAVFIAFLLCWTPVITIGILIMFREDYPLQRQVYLIASFTGGAANAVFNPAIYGFTQKRFREAYKEILTCTRN